MMHRGQVWPSAAKTTPLPPPSPGGVPAQPSPAQATAPCLSERQRGRPPPHNCCWGNCRCVRPMAAARATPGTRHRTAASFRCGAPCGGRLPQRCPRSTPSTVRRPPAAPRPAPRSAPPRVAATAHSLCRDAAAEEGSQQHWPGPPGPSAASLHAPHRTLWPSGPTQLPVSAPRPPCWPRGGRHRCRWEQQPWVLQTCRHRRCRRPPRQPRRHHHPPTPQLPQLLLLWRWRAQCLHRYGLRCRAPERDVPPRRPSGRALPRSCCRCSSDPRPLQQPPPSARTLSTVRSWRLQWWWPSSSTATRRRNAAPTAR
mmetsp:Transcript_53098/g.114067  ORF Transcript_53098/g.114067 Transcript_53098/m.114067 type:complete len:312 (+) Transcript_53098:92-1027(+)